MTESNQSWFENISVKRSEVLGFNSGWDLKLSNIYLDMIRTGIEKMDTSISQTTTVEKRLAAALWRFFTLECIFNYQVLGIAQSTVAKIVQEATFELLHVSSEFIEFPFDSITACYSYKTFC